MGTKQITIMFILHSNTMHALLNFVHRETVNLLWFRSLHEHETRPTNDVTVSICNRNCKPLLLSANPSVDQQIY